LVTADCGFVLPDSEDPQALAAVLNRLANHRELRQKMGQAGRTIAEQHIWASKAKIYVDLFEEMSKS
jgi:glycosyltransferase involved in cell wall biosynthesis